MISRHHSASSGSTSMICRVVTSRELMSGEVAEVSDVVHCFSDVNWQNFAWVGLIQYVVDLLSEIVCTVTLVLKEYLGVRAARVPPTPLG